MSTEAILVIVSFAGVFLIAGIYAIIYGLVAKFGMNARLNGLRSYWASVIGLILGFAFLAASGAWAFYQPAANRVVFAILGLGGLALVMTAINVLIVRTKEGAKITFIQGFMMQLVPNILLIAFSIATRPPY